MGGKIMRGGRFHDWFWEDAERRYRFNTDQHGNCTETALIYSGADPAIEI
jgi:hypothetical protein